MRFAVSGVEYVIDLSEKNAAKCHQALGPYVDAAHPSRRPRTAKRTGATSGAVSRGQEGAAMRVWARENEFEVSSRGRVPRKVVEAYRGSR